MERLMLGSPVKRHLGCIAFAGFSALLTKHGYTLYQKDRVKAQQHYDYSLVVGALGGVCGVGGMFSGVRAITVLLIIPMGSMIGFTGTYSFLTLRSALSDAKLEMKGKPLNELMLTSSTAGGLMSGCSLLIKGFSPVIQMGSFTGGCVTGFIGHYFYEKYVKWKREKLLKDRHPELLGQLEKAYEYIDERQILEPDYEGPKKPVVVGPWMQYSEDKYQELVEARQRAAEKSGEKQKSM